MKALAQTTGPSQTVTGLKPDDTITSQATLAERPKAKLISVESVVSSPPKTAGS